MGQLYSASDLSYRFADDQGVSGTLTQMVAQMLERYPGCNGPGFKSH